MDEPYLGEIRPVTIPYAPKGWYFCNGQLLSIQQNQALFSLLGTTYGGNGTTTFALPDLRSRIPVGAGQAPGLSNYVLGQVGGQESVALQAAQMPQHVHPFTGSLQTSPDQDEGNPNLQLPAIGTLSQYSNGANNTAMGGTISGATTTAGGGQPHENRMPYQALNYVIAYQGIFPSRS
ncbi:tail fiber protein [Hymenobacter sp. BT635]|uniref:Tail fiber protein n=1 Tax=Hymenobacter nitidus TaxID=2880929 RepID=A0ABS8A7R4_9BACT|nr:tail fiber protein [Hymenobacter nitidus]MCB2376440.1 tail fiber protein [Hymenobacter nitidus]